LLTLTFRRLDFPSTTAAGTRGFGYRQARKRSTKIPLDQRFLSTAARLQSEYIWGEKLLKFIRCEVCGCVMQWRKLNVSVDGAKTWKYVG
jgi:hypothetical protein